MAEDFFAGLPFAVGAGAMGGGFALGFFGALAVLALDAVHLLLALSIEATEGFADDHGVNCAVETAVGASFELGDEEHEFGEAQVPILREDDGGEVVESGGCDFVACSCILAEVAKLDFDPGDGGGAAVGLADSVEFGSPSAVDAAAVADADDGGGAVGIVGGEEAGAVGILALEGERFGVGGGGKKPPSNPPDWGEAVRRGGCRAVRELRAAA